MANTAQLPQNSIQSAAEATPENKTEEYIKSLQVASKAAILGSRPPTISIIARINLVKARKIFQDVTGTPPVKGCTPSDLGHYISTAQCHLESVWLAQAFKNLVHADDDHFRQCECLFTAYEQYLQNFSSPTISFDRYFLLIRNMFFSSNIVLVRCKECGCGKLLIKSWDPTRVVDCPVCYITAQH